MWHVWVERDGGEGCTGFWSGNLKERDQFQDLCIGGKIILTQHYRAWNGFIWFRTGTWALVKTVMNPRLPQNASNLWSSWDTAGVSRRFCSKQLQTRNYRGLQCGQTGTTLSPFLREKTKENAAWEVNLSNKCSSISYSSPVSLANFSFIGWQSSWVQSLRQL